jgi:hypothetical protein
VHLRDRGGGHRPVVERKEQLGHGPLQLGLDDGPGLGRREWGQAVLELGQVARDRVAQEVAADGQGLAELNEGGAQLLECLGQALAGAAWCPAVGHAPR